MVGEGEETFSDFGTTGIEAVISKANETTWKHDFSAEDGNCFHAVAKQHQGYEFAGIDVSSDELFSTVASEREKECEKEIGK